MKKFLFKFTWYRRRLLRKAIIDLGDVGSKSFWKSLTTWIHLYPEFILDTDMMQIRLTESYTRVIDVLAVLECYKYEIDKGQRALPKTTSRNNILLEDWFVDKDNVRYTIEEFNYNLNRLALCLGEGLMDMDYSNMNYYLGRYDFLYVTLRNYVAAINRQLKV